MLKVVLTNRLINALARRFLGSYLAKKFGIDSKITINELCAVETTDGKVKLKINAELEMTSDEAERIIKTI